MIFEMLYCISFFYKTCLTSRVESVYFFFEASPQKKASQAHRRFNFQIRTPTTSENVQNSRPRSAGGLLRKHGLEDLVSAAEEVAAEVAQLSC